MNKIRIGIVGYGNLGRGVEMAIAQNPDMELTAVISRRSITINTPHVPVVSPDNVQSVKGEVDVLLLCGGSATDLPEQTPYYTQYFNTVDSFDNHSQIPVHFSKVDAVAKKNGTVSVISVGWDPGMFSVNRLYSACILPQSKQYTFFGPGISQGHSDAVRRVAGVLDARQYTIPKAEAMEQVRAGLNPELTTRQKHLRECFVVAAPDADKAKIEQDIKDMPAYFADYDTIVHFISSDELSEKHSALPHGGFVLTSGVTGDGTTKQVVEYSLKLDSNPEFTSSVMIAFARAAHRLSRQGTSGCHTIFDIAPALLSPKAPEDMRKEML